jgi:TonB family protein
VEPPQLSGTVSAPAAVPARTARVANLQAPRDPFPAVRVSVAGLANRLRQPLLAEIAAPSPAGPKVYDSRALDQQPVPVSQARPVYPYDMKKQRYSGEVVVEFILDSAGVVHDAHVLSSSRKDFEKSAVEAVSKWRFRPGRKGGAPVNVRMQIPIVYSLNRDG